MLSIRLLVLFALLFPVEYTRKDLAVEYTREESAEFEQRLRGRVRSGGAVAEGGGSGFDLSEYRTATYGSPDRYCDFTKSATGTGTLGDPWNPAQCKSQPVCGEVVGVLDVGSGATGTIQQFAVSGLDMQEAAFRPTNASAQSCANGNELVYVARYPAITMVNLSDPTSSTIGSNSQRTEIRTDATADAADVQGTGRPVYGCYNQDNIIFDGFYVDMAQAEITGDQGVIGFRSDDASAVVGCEAHNFAIKGTTTDIDSNPVIYRPGLTTNSVLRNFAAWDFDNIPTGAGLNQQGLFSDHYGDQNYLIEYFLLDSTDRGIFPKGTANGVFNYGIIRYGISRNMTGECMRFNDFDATNQTEVHHLLMINCATSGVTFGLETSQARNALFHHLTINIANGGAGGLFDRDGTVQSVDTATVTVRDSIMDLGNSGHGVAFGGETAVPTLNNNGYYRGGSTVTWAFNGNEYNTLGNWQAATSQDANSTVFISDPFNNEAGGDYSIAAGHDALTRSSTGGEVGAYEGSIDPGPRTQ